MGLVYGKLERVKQASRGACGNATHLTGHRTIATQSGTQLQLMDHGSRGLNNGTRYILKSRW